MHQQISEIQQRVARVETKQDIVIQMLREMPCKDHAKDISDSKVLIEKTNTKIVGVKLWTLMTLVSLILSIASLAATLR